MKDDKATFVAKVMMRLALKRVLHNKSKKHLVASYVSDKNVPRKKYWHRQQFR